MALLDLEFDELCARINARVSGPAISPPSAQPATPAGSGVVQFYKFVIVFFLILDLLLVFVAIVAISFVFVAIVEVLLVFLGMLLLWTFYFVVILAFVVIVVSFCSRI